MAIFSGEQPSWGEHFGVQRVDVDDGQEDGFVRLAQTTDTHFRLESVIHYGGETGLEKHLGDDSPAWPLLRTLNPEDLENTDLASIPAPMRWWINTYGRHTPAALIHDRFIGLPEGLPAELADAGLGEQHIDRYFRYMLGDAGIEFVPRWVMWSAVALRTRWAPKDGERIWDVRRWSVKRAGLVLWGALAIAGIAGFFWAILTSSWLLALVFALAPIPASLALWSKQWAAGIWASYVAGPLMLIPVAVGVILLLPFLLFVKLFGRALEHIARKVPFFTIEPSYYSDEVVANRGPRSPDGFDGISGPHQAA